MACVNNTIQENEMFSYDPFAEGTGLCTRTFETVMTNSLSTGAVVGTPIRTSDSERSTKDNCCMQGNTMMDASLLMACNMMETTENEMFTYDPAGAQGAGSCTRAFDIVVTNSFSDG